jgi:hypothetical protein
MQLSIDDGTGEEIKHRMTWVPLEQPISLVMDNAGGGAWKERSSG